MLRRPHDVAADELVAGRRGCEPVPEWKAVMLPSASMTVRPEVVAGARASMLRPGGELARLVHELLTQAICGCGWQKVIEDGGAGRRGAGQ